MKLWEFKKLKEIPNLFLFYGDEFFLDIYYQKIQNKIKQANTIKMYFNEVDIDLAKSHISQNSLFGDKNALVIKTDKFPKIDNLTKVVGDNYCYLFFYGDTKKVRTKPFEQNFVRFFKPDLRDLIIASNEYMTSKNIQISIEHLKYLISKTDYRFLFQEIDKLALVDILSNRLIDKLVFDYNETSFDEVFDSLFLNQDYLKKLEYLIFEGNDEIQILMSFSRYIKNLYMFSLHIKNIGYENVSKDVLGYQIPKNLEEMRKQLAFSVKENSFLKLFEIVLNSELDMKSSKDKSAILFRTFIEIKRILE